MCLSWFWLKVWDQLLWISIWWSQLRSMSHAEDMRVRLASRCNLWLNVYCLGTILKRLLLLPHVMLERCTSGRFRLKAWGCEWGESITDAKGSENHSDLNSISWYQASNFCAYIVPINMYWEILSWSVFRAKVAWSDWVGDPGNKPKVLEWPKFRSWGVKVARARTRKPAFYISK